MSGHNGDETPKTTHTTDGSQPAEASNRTQPEDPAQLRQLSPLHSRAPRAQDDSVQPGPKMVRRVVVSYRLGWLPGNWLQTWRRLERVFGRADLKVKATLAPLEDLPTDTDILVVPPELREAAREAALPNTPILVTPASAAAGAFADLVSRLQAGTEFTAERLDPADKTSADNCHPKRG